MRVFVAVVPPADVVEHLDEFLSVRRDAAAFRWSAAEQWHVTLAFSPDVSDRSVDHLDERLATVSGRRRAFEARITGGGALPDPDRARVLFARLAGDGGRVLPSRVAACPDCLLRAIWTTRRRAWTSSGSSSSPTPCGPTPAPPSTRSPRLGCDRSWSRATTRPRPAGSPMTSGS